MALFKKKQDTTVSTTDGEPISYTWKTEVARDLRTIIVAIESHDPDYKTVARDLRALHLDFFADKLEVEAYHLQAKHRNKVANPTKS